MSNKILKSASQISILTFSSRILGLVREQVRAHFLGTTFASDAFGIAFMIPNMFRRLFAEGAMTAAFIPVLSDLNESDKKKEMWHFASQCFTLLSIILVLFTALFILFAPMLNQEIFARGFSGDIEKLLLTTKLTRLMFVYILFISLSALVQGVLNINGIYWVSAVTPVLLNICIIGCAFFFSQFYHQPVYGFGFGVIIGGAVQLFFQIPPAIKLGMTFWTSLFPLHHDVKRVLKLMIPGIFSAGVYQVNILASEVIATYLKSGSIAALQYSNRLLELTLGIFVVSFATVILPTLSKQASNKDYSAMQESLLYSFRMVAFITLPATIGLILFAKPIIASLFQFGKFNEESVHLTEIALVFHAMGLFFIGSNRILAPAYYALKDMKTPLKLGLIAVIANIVLCLLLTPYLDHGGIAAANSISGCIHMALFLFFLPPVIRSMKLSSILPDILRICLASGVMGAACWGLTVYTSLESIDNYLIRLITTLASITLMICLYLIISYTLKSREFSSFIQLISKKIRI